MAVSGGIFNYLTQSNSPAAIAVQNLLAKLPAVGAMPQYSIYPSLAPKQSPRPYLVMHVTNAPPAAESLDGVSELTRGEIQFDSYGDDQNGARALSRAVRDALKNFNGTLNDGTTIQFYSVALDVDDPYEEGGSGYVFRSVLRLKAFYNESVPFPVSLADGFNLEIEHGLSGSAPVGITVNIPGLQFSTGALASGNPLTGAEFLPGSPLSFHFGTFTGTWEGNIEWTQVGNSPTYMLIGSVSNAQNQQVPVIIAFEKVVFGVGGFSN